MANVTVIGSQWGDEGKGKIVDWLSERADIVVRFQGGHNAGHTLQIGDATYKLSLLPSGLARGKLSVIGNGVVIDPWALLDEINRIRAQGLTVTPANLRISENATVILPFYAQLDQAREKARGKGAIGTTGRGIGIAYEDKVARRAIRMCDLAEPETLAAKIGPLLQHHNLFLRGLGEPEVDGAALAETLGAVAAELTDYIEPAWRRLHAARKAGKRLLFEGAQGTMLDIDHGTYPFVTSSNTVAASAGAGAGIGAEAVGYVLGITKAYTTRVGGGPFPTEQDNEIGKFLGTRGHEFGTVTGRERRCGWFDAVMVRQAVQVGGIDGIALTKLDVLDEMEELKVCVAYRDAAGKEYDYFPASMQLQEQVTPVYETMEGWSESTRGAKSWAELPATAIKYVRRIEELIGAPVALLSTGPERDETILVTDPFAD